jgi:anhydro-N-acetylmuramic acid kinase
MPAVLKAIGLMSGTSMDGIDAAYLETDGVDVKAQGPALTIPYTDAFRQRLRQFIAAAPEPGHSDQAALEADLTDLHVSAVNELRKQIGPVDLIGFHGHTVWHRPQKRATWQMGDGARLAKATGIPVVFDLRSADVAAGGQGAPLLPVYHAALARPLECPIAVLNVGGVANVTWISEAFLDAPKPDGLLAFDTGPGNAQIDDWVHAQLGLDMDRGGAIAAKGRVHEDIVAKLMTMPFFAVKPPKSLDRLDFSTKPVEGLSAEDGAATLTAFTAASVARALAFCAQRPRRLLVTGGGRHNATLMREIEKRSGIFVAPVETVGWNGDALEAQGFALLAVRSQRGLPLTFPGTTGVSAPLSGGRLAQP